MCGWWPGWPTASHRSTHTISAAGIEFVVPGAHAPRNGTLREIRGDLAPVGVLHCENSLTPGAVVACPGLAMVDMSTQTRVIAIAPTGQPTTLHPRRDTRLSAGDTAYFVGPYREHQRSPGTQ